MEAGELGAYGLHPFDEERGAEPAVDGNAFVVETVDEGDQFVRTVDGDLFDEAAITGEGELAGGGVEKMGGDVADGPGGDDDGEAPLRGRERAQQGEEGLIDLANEGGGEDGRRSSPHAQLYNINVSSDSKLSACIPLAAEGS